MKLTSFLPRDISLSDDFVGFPLIHQDLSDIVKYLGHLMMITQEGKDDYKRMLIAAESGALFLGRTGAGKTHALHCVVNEAIKLDYYTVYLKKDFFISLEFKNKKAKIKAHKWYKNQCLADPGRMAEAVRLAHA